MKKFDDTNPCKNRAAVMLRAHVDETGRPAKSHAELYDLAIAAIADIIEWAAELSDTGWGFPLANEFPDVGLRNPDGCRWWNATSRGAAVATVALRQFEDARGVIRAQEVAA